MVDRRYVGPCRFCGQTCESKNEKNCICAVCFTVRYAARRNLSACKEIIQEVENE